MKRPDLRPPKWNVTYYDRSRVAPGYWFVSPYSFDNNWHSDVKWHECEIGPAIYDSEGELVWSGACQFGNQNFQNFRLSPFWGDEEQVLSGVVDHSPLYEGGFAGVFLGSDYEVQHAVPADEFHEFDVFDGGTRVLSSMGGSVTLPVQLGPDGKTEQQQTEAERTGFREFDPRTGEMFFEWQTLEHLDLDESTIPRPEGRNAWWEAFHLNSVDKTDDGHYLVSLRHANVILLIDGEDGHVIWRAGGTKNDFSFLDGLSWSRQHDARVISSNKTQTVISLFDNVTSKKCSGPNCPTARGLLVALNHPTGGEWTAETLRQYDRPDGKTSHKCGSLQQLPNDNVFMCWVEGGYISEHTEGGETLMEARWLRDDRFGTYRGFKFDGWVGRPKDNPTAKAMVMGVEGSVAVTTIYVSWNGATEVRSWDFYFEDVKIGSMKRTGFETSFVVAEAYDRIRVKAIDAEGTVLGESEEVAAEILYMEADHGSLSSKRYHTVREYSRLTWANIFVLSAAVAFFAVRIARRRFGKFSIRHYRFPSDDLETKLV